MSIFSYMSMQGMMKNTPGPGHQIDHNLGDIYDGVICDNDIVDGDIFVNYGIKNTSSPTCK